MNNKKVKMFVSIIIIVAILGCAGFYITTKLKNNKVDYYNEYTPQEEISDEQFRSTIVKLYFLNKSTGRVLNTFS